MHTTEFYFERRLCYSFHSRLGAAMRIKDMMPKFVVHDRLKKTGKWIKRSLYAFGALFLVFSGLTVFNIDGLNTYEEGWRAGSLAGYSISNRLLQGVFTPGAFFATGEGDILLGDSSSHHATINGRQISPSYFSTSVALFHKDNALISSSVAIHFRRLDHSWFINGKTDVRVDHFQKLQDVNIATDCQSGQGWFGVSHGKIGGKIVEVAKVGSPILWKTYEVIIFLGGNEFKEMSIRSRNIYRCAITALKSGKTVRISYEKDYLRNPFWQRTYYDVTGIKSQ